MKKLLLLGSAFALFTVAASAQESKEVRPEKKRFETHQLQRGEKPRADKKKTGFYRSDKKFKHDGRMSKFDKRKVYKMKHHDRKNHRFHFKNKKRA